MQHEKRQAIRKRMDQLLYAELGPNNGSIVLNLSEQGCGFQAIAPVREKELHFTFAIGGGQEIHGTGRVTWLEKTKKSGGLRFINLSASLREQIRAWLADPRAIDPSAPPEALGATTPAESEAKLRRTRLREEARRQWEAAQRFREDQRLQSDAISQDPEAARQFRISSAELPAQSDDAFTPQSGSRRAGGFWRGVAAIALGAALGLLLVAYHREVGRALIWLGVALSEGAEDTRGAPGYSARSPVTAGISANTTTAHSVSRPARSSSQTAFNASRTTDSAAPNPLSLGTPASLPSLSGSQAAQETSGPADPYSLEDVQTLWTQVENGDTRAEVALADRYLSGNGVPKSCGQARVLLQAALKRGHPDAQRKLDALRQAECP